MAGDFAPLPPKIGPDTPAEAVFRFERFRARNTMRQKVL
jgi:hypothetical protein